MRSDDYDNNRKELSAQAAAICFALALALVALVSIVHLIIGD